MINGIIKKIKIYYIPFIIFFIISLMIMMRVNVHSGDDLVFTEAFRNYGGVINWIKSYTHIWSGRVIPHLILVILLNRNLIIWKVCNSIMLTLLSISIFNLIINKNSNMDDRNKVILGSGICGLLLFLPESIFTSGATWVTGSVTYLWPITFAIVAILPFKRLITGEKSGKLVIISSIISAVYASNVEQSAAVMTVFSILLLIYALIKKRENIKVYHYFIVILMIVITSICLLVPGNSVRFDAELLLWYPDFNMLSFIDKLYLGLSNTLNHIFNSAKVLMLVFSILLMISVIKKVEDKLTQLVSTIPFIYQVLQLCNVKFLFEFNKGNDLLIGGLMQYISNICGIFVLLVIIYLLFIIFDSLEDGIIIALLFIAGICSALSVSVSPTIFISGSRVFFVTDILLILCISSLMYEVVKKYYKNIKFNDNIFIVFMVIMTIISINFIVNIAPKLMLG